MAYSMFECPKLQNARSLKFYPEEYDHHIPFRHRTLPPDFELTVENYSSHHVKQVVNCKGNYSMEAQSSTHEKCPIYIHSFSKIHNEGDFGAKNYKKNKKVFEKLEETYWAHWKPDKNKLKESPKKKKKAKSPQIKVIKSAPVKKKKIRVFPDDDIATQISEDRHKISSKSQEIQTDEIEVKEETVETQTVDEAEEIEKEEQDEKFLRHTDSYILNQIRKRKDAQKVEHFEQPKCIRLYRKPGKNASKNYVKGGSYPLKSCLKKENSFGKGSHKFGRPGSPLIISSNFSTKSKNGKSHRR